MSLYSNIYKQSLIKRFKGGVSRTPPLRNIKYLGTQEHLKISENPKKKCTKCLEYKNIKEFHNHKRMKDGKSTRCRSCTKVLNAEYRAENLDKERNRKLIRKFGITLEQYKIMLQDQNNKCAICATSECSSGVSFAVDHCHVTGKVRALLCGACNTGLGKFKDNFDLLEKASKYLKLHGEIKDG